MTVSPADGGVVKVDGVVYTGNCGYSTGAVANIEAVAADIYRFHSWGGSLSGSTNPTTITMNSDKNVTANFVLNADEVDLSEAKSLVDGSKDVLVVDVSTAADFAGSHMLCAKNYIWNSSTKSFSSSITNLNTYKDDVILVYDQNGTKSEDAAFYLAGQGFENVFYMTDAFDPDWMAENETFITAEDEDICTSLTPMAYAGPDQTDQKSADENQPVTLDGSGSSSGVTYAWIQVGGVNDVALSDPEAPKPTFTAPDLNGGNDTLVFQLTVTDGGGDTDTDRVIVDVDWNNADPIASAGPDQTVAPGALVTLNGADSTDPENSIESYQWAATSGTITPPLSNSSTATPSFTAPATAGWVIYELTVTDNGGVTDKDTVKITVQAEPEDPNVPPVSDAGADQTVTEGQTVTLNGSESTDSDGTITSRVWAQTGGTPAVTLMPNSGAIKPTFTAPGVTAATVLTFSLTVTDDDGESDGDTVQITVNDDGIPAQNEAPTADAGADQSLKEGKTVTLDGNGSTDSDGTIASYAWTQTDNTGITVTLSNSSAANPTFAAPDVDAATTLTFSLIVTDDDDVPSSSDAVSITVTESSSGGGGGGCFINSLAD